MDWGWTGQKGKGKDSKVITSQLGAIVVEDSGPFNLAMVCKIIKRAKMGVGGRREAGKGYWRQFTQSRISVSSH